MPESTDEAIRRAAEEELGPEVAHALPPVDRPPPVPRDPGADRLVRQMVEALGERTRGEDGQTRVCLSKLRNLSRAQPAEFSEFLDRLADVLSRSGREWNVAFVSRRGEQPAHYDVLGTAYIMTTEGFDVWEVFMVVTPAETGWTLWQPSGPVRILRRPRPGQQQVFPSP